MIKRLLLSVLAAIPFALGLQSCGGGAPEPQGKGIFTAIANHRIGFAPLVLNSSFAYENSAGNLFKVSEFRYYLSEVKLHKKGGGVYQHPMSPETGAGYFLVEESDPESKLIVLRDVPAGEYTAISFKVGIEPGTVNPETAQGVLAKTRDMYSPEDGYYSLFLEGMAYDSSEDDQRLAMRTGGQVYEARVDFAAETAIVEPELETVMEYNADLGELFDLSTPTDFSDTPLLLNIEANQAAARQFAQQGFGFDHVHNNP